MTITIRPSTDTTIRTCPARTDLEAGTGQSGPGFNHNQAPASPKVKTRIRAGDGTGGIGPVFNHNQASASPKVKTRIKAGNPVIQHNQSTARPHGAQRRAPVGR